MKYTFAKQARRTGLALAAVAGFTALGIGTAQAQEFARATIALDKFGNLECNFRETGLTYPGFVRYDCSSQYVGVLRQCMLKNKPVGNSQLLIFQDIHAHEIENFEVKKNGSVNATIFAEVPESESNELICTVPAELTVTAIRWCNNTLTDLTNGIVGANVAELFDQLVSNGSGTVPSCTVLANGPFTTPGE